MKPSKNRARRRPTAAPCAQWHADDGAPAERLFRQSFRNKPDRKTLQLCGQVRRALSGALAGCGDPALQALYVESVEPAPDAGRLRVTVVAAGVTAADVPPLLARLERASGLLRHDAAAAVVRKRAPELTFHVRPGGEGQS